MREQNQGIWRAYYDDAVKNRRWDRQHHEFAGSHAMLEFSPSMVDNRTGDCLGQTLPETEEESTDCPLPRLAARR